MWWLSSWSGWNNFLLLNLNFLLYWCLLFLFCFNYWSFLLLFASWLISLWFWSFHSWLNIFTRNRPFWLLFWSYLFNFLLRLFLDLNFLWSSSSKIMMDLFHDNILNYQMLFMRGLLFLFRSFSNGLLLYFLTTLLRLYFLRCLLLFLFGWCFNNFLLRSDFFLWFQRC